MLHRKRVRGDDVRHRQLENAAWDPATQVDVDEVPGILPLVLRTGIRMPYAPCRYALSPRTPSTPRGNGSDVGDATLRGPRASGLFRRKVFSRRPGCWKSDIPAPGGAKWWSVVGRPGNLRERTRALVLRHDDEARAPVPTPHKPINLCLLIAAGRRHSERRHGGAATRRKSEVALRMPPTPALPHDATCCRAGNGATDSQRRGAARACTNWWEGLAGGCSGTQGVLAGYSQGREGWRVDAALAEG